MKYVFAALAFFTTSVLTANAVEPKQALETMLESIEEKDFDKFCQYGADSFKKELTSKDFRNLCNYFDLAGHHLEFFGTIFRGGYEETCWKICMANKEEMLIRLFIQDGEVLGLLII